MKKNLSIKIKHLAIMVPVLLTLLSACDKRMRPHVHEHFNVAREDGKIIVKSSSKGHVTSIFYYKDGEYYDSSDSTLFFSTKKDTTINVFFLWNKISNRNKKGKREPIQYNILFNS